MKLCRIALLFSLSLCLLGTASCSREPFRSPYVEEGIVSWYGWDYALKKTASGERFKPWSMTAAHKTLPFGTIVRVTRLDTGKSIKLRINDRGPFVKGRIIDVSKKGAKELDLIDAGIARCRVEVLEFPDAQSNG